LLIIKYIVGYKREKTRVIEGYGSTREGDNYGAKPLHFKIIFMLPTLEF
jgi:hypothetical protein